VPARSAADAGRVVSRTGSHCRGQMDAAPATRRSLQATSSTANAHRPPTRPSMFPAPTALWWRSSAPVVSHVISSANRAGHRTGTLRCESGKSVSSVDLQAHTADPIPRLCPQAGDGTVPTGGSADPTSSRSPLVAELSDASMMISATSVAGTVELSVCSRHLFHPCNRLTISRPASAIERAWAQASNASRMCSIKAAPE